MQGKEGPSCHQPTAELCQAGVKTICHQTAWKLPMLARRQHAGSRSIAALLVREGQVQLSRLPFLRSLAAPSRTAETIAPKISSPAPAKAPYLDSAAQRLRTNQYD